MIGASPFGAAPFGDAGTSGGAVAGDGGTANADAHLPVIQASGFGGGAASLSLPAIMAQGSNEVLATGAAVLPTLAATCRSGAVAGLGLLRLSASAYGGSSAAPSLPGFSISSTGTRQPTQGASVFMPRLAVASYGGAVASITLPSLGLSTSTSTVEVARASATLPALGAIGGGTTGGVGRVSVALPALAASVTATNPWRGSGSATLPTFSVLATAGQRIAQSSITLPSLSLSATAVNPETATAALSMPAMSFSAFGGASASVAIGRIIAAANGTAGGVAAASISLPRLSVSGEATRQNSASAAVSLPALRLDTGASISAALPAFRSSASATTAFAVSYEAYAMHMSQSPGSMTNQVTRYSGYPFTRIVRFRGESYGIAADGIYLLGGPTDAGLPIAWRFESCLTDFGLAQKKNVASAYFAGRLGANVSVKVVAGDSPSQTHVHTTVPVAHAVNHREKLGRGRVTRYFAFGASGSGDLSLDAMEFEINQATRRI